MAPPETQPNSAPETDEEPTDEALAKVEKEETEQKEEVDPDAFAPELNAIAIYLHALRKNPLLTPEEEVELSKQIDPVREEYMALFSGIEKLRMRVEDKDILPTEEDVERLELCAENWGNMILMSDIWNCRKKYRNYEDLNSNILVCENLNAN